MQTEQSCLTVVCDEERGYPFPSERDIVRLEIRQALLILTPRERSAISLLFGIQCYAEGNYTQIGRTMGVSRRCARRLISRALAKLSHVPMLQLLMHSLSVTWTDKKETPMAVTNEQYFSHLSASGLELAEAYLEQDLATLQENDLPVSDTVMGLLMVHERLAEQDDNTKETL
jgi:Sigma-70, region 4